MRNFYLLALVWLMALSAYGQKMKTAVADKYYEDYQFLAAAQAYERIIKTDAKNVAVMEKLVSCYTRLNDPVKSEFWLAKVLQTPQAPAKSFKTFGTLLAANGKYEEASRWFNKSYEETRDEESLRWLNSYRNLQQFYADSALYQISKVTFNSRYSDFSPTFYQEGVVFSSARDNGKINKMKFDYNNTWFIDLYFVKDTLSRPVPFSDVLNSRYHEGPLSFTPDQKTVYFTRNNHLKKSFFSSDGVSKLKIYYASSYNGRWGQIREFNLNNKEYSVGQPALASDNLMYFVSDMPGGFGGTDLYQTEKVNGEWQKPVNLGPGINTSGNEMFPYVGEGNLLYFASNGHPGLGGLDVFFTAVSGTNFGEVTNLGYPVNTSRDDFGFIIRNHHGYFSSNRGGKTTSDDIYRFKVRQHPPVMVIAREEPASKGADSLSEEQGKELALALAQQKDPQQPAATTPGSQEGGEEGEEEKEKLRAAAAADLSGTPPLGELADAGALPKGQQDAAAKQLAEALTADAKQAAQKDLLPAGGGAGGLDKPLPEKPGAGRGSESLSGLALATPSTRNLADPEEENRNTFDLEKAAGSPETAAAGQAAGSPETAAAGQAAGSPETAIAGQGAGAAASADPWKNLDAFQDAASRPDSTSRGIVAGALSGKSSPENGGAFPADAGTGKRLAAPAGHASSENAAGLPGAAGQKDQAGALTGISSPADTLAAALASAQETQAQALALNSPEEEIGASLAGKGNQQKSISDYPTNEKSLAAEQNYQSDTLSGLASAKRDSLTGATSAEHTDARERLALQGRVQDHAGEQRQEGIVPDARPGQALAETGAQAAGEQPDGNDSDDFAQTGKINRMKSLPKEFKTGAVGEIIELEILYDLDKTTIRPDAAHVLNGLVAYMKRNPQVKVELGAHTDVRGSDDYNEKLSQGRAESVVDYMARHGIARNRLVPVGFGEKDLAIADAGNEAEHQVNRRTTARIFANEALLMAYHEAVTQPKLAAIRARQQQEKASRLAASFPLLPSPDASLTAAEANEAGQQPAAAEAVAIETTSATAGAQPVANKTSGQAIYEVDTALPAAGTDGRQARDTRLIAAAEDGAPLEEAASAPAAVYAREMLFWNPRASDPKTAAAQAKKNPDTFFIISNAFLSLEEAEWYMQEVLDLGGEGRIIMPFAGSKLYRVAVAGYTRYKDAERQLPRKKQVFGVHSWILGLNSQEFALRRMAPQQPVPQAVASLDVPAPAPTPLAVPAVAAGNNTLLASANALIATLEQRMEKLETRLAAVEAGAARKVKTYAQAPKAFYGKMVEANRHRASARLWAEVAPHTIDQKTGRAYIIAGSFSTLGSANWYRKKMARMGGESKIILPNPTNRLYLVTVADYADRNEARQKLFSLKRTFGLYIWIFDY